MNTELDQLFDLILVPQNIQAKLSSLECKIISQKLQKYCVIFKDFQLEMKISVDGITPQLAMRFAKEHYQETANSIVNQDFMVYREIIKNYSKQKMITKKAFLQGITKSKHHFNIGFQLLMEAKLKKSNSIDSISCFLNDCVTKIKTFCVHFSDAPFDQILISEQTHPNDFFDFICQANIDQSLKSMVLSKMHEFQQAILEKVREQYDQKPEQRTHNHQQFQRKDSFSRDSQNEKIKNVQQELDRTRSILYSTEMFLSDYKTACSKISEDCRKLNALLVEQQKQNQHIKQKSSQLMENYEIQIAELKEIFKASEATCQRLERQLQTEKNLRSEIEIQLIGMQNKFKEIENNKLQLLRQPFQCSQIQNTVQKFDRLTEDLGEQNCRGIQNSPIKENRQKPEIFWSQKDVDDLVSGLNERKSKVDQQLKNTKKDLELIKKELELIKYKASLPCEPCKQLRNNIEKLKQAGKKQTVKLKNAELELEKTKNELNELKGKHCQNCKKLKQSIKKIDQQSKKQINDSLLRVKKQITLIKEQNKKLSSSNKQMCQALDKIKKQLKAEKTKAKTPCSNCERLNKNIQQKTNQQNKLAKQICDIQTQNQNLIKLTSSKDKQISDLKAKFQKSKKSVYEKITEFISFVFLLFSLLYFIGQSINGNHIFKEQFQTYFLLTTTILSHKFIANTFMVTAALLFSMIIFEPFVSR